MDLLQEAFIHAPELCEAHFTTDVRALFDVLSWTETPAHCNDNSWKCKDNL